MRRLRLPGMTAIVAAVLVMLMAVPLAVGRETAAAASAHRVHVIAAKTVSYETTAAESTTGGLCSVPGIGDIGGLLGFCSLGSSGLLGDLNNICSPSLPDPEPANSGINAMVAPPASGSRQPATLYDEYGIAGDNWAATGLQCSDMTSLIGNDVAGMVFDVAKSIDRVTITIYQSAAGSGLLSWLQRVTDKLITGLGKAIYFPYLAVVVIIGAIWLAWQGLIRKRATRTIEGTLWMVVACAAAILLIGKPAAVTGLGTAVSDGMSQTLNAAYAKLPSPGPSSCVPVQKGDPQAQPSSYSYVSSSTVVDQNADELWTVLVCKPWLDGEFGTSLYSPRGARPTLVNTYARSLLWAQAIAVDEKPTSALIQAKQAAYAGIASSLQSNDPAVYPLFQGKQWTTRLEIAFAALFAAAVAGVLILLISVTLILLKLGFLLLLIAGPFFMLIGTHPGFGRVVAVRWLELLVGVLLKQAAVAVVLSVLLYCYALIMGTSDAVLPWALKILMIALVSVAAFIYRKPFQHLFSAVGYGVIGSHDQAAADLQRAGASARSNTVSAATLAVPPFAAYRAGRWARRNPAQAAGLALGATSGGVGAAAGLAGTGAGQAAGAAATEGLAAAAAGADESIAGAAGRSVLTARVRAMANGDNPPAAEPPPLNLPARGSAPASNGLGASPTAAASASAPRWPSRPSGSGAGAGPLAARSLTDYSAAPGRVAQREQAPVRSGAVQESAPRRAPARDAGPRSAAPRGVSPRLVRGNSPGVREPARGGGPPAWAAPRERGSSRPDGSPTAPQGGLEGEAAAPNGPFWLRPIRRK
jgi:hypothetical protein